MNINFDNERLTVVGFALLMLLAHVVLLNDFPLLWQAVAALLLSGWLPGALLVEWLLGKGTWTRAERALYSIGASYTIMVVVMLFVSYLPGPVSRWQTFMAFDLVLVVLGVLSYRQMRQQAREKKTITGIQGKTKQALDSSFSSRLMMAALLSLLLVGGFFRLSNLGYSEFQGDEARAALRAAAVIQGYEEVLFLHRKGPTEILLPTVIYSLTERLNEQMARLPFALANLAGLFAIFLLGWRLFGPVAGWSAAMLLALDGYLIAFAHILQYQSVVFLMSVLVVLLVYRPDLPSFSGNDKNRNQNFLSPDYWGGQILAALFLVTGLLSHYDAIFALLPATFLLAYPLIQQVRSPNPRPFFLTILTRFRILLFPILISTLILASFYIPFLLHPNFSDTYTYLAERRIGSHFPFNNLADFFMRTTLYSTTYYVVLITSLAMIALLQAYRRGLGRLGIVLGMIPVAGVLLTIWNPNWLRFAETDFVVILFGLVFLSLWLMPGLSANERMLWLWFGIPMLIAFFFILKPRTHVYIFFMPWMLLVGMVIQRSVDFFRQTSIEQKKVRHQVIVIIGSILATLVVLVFGSYAYWYFIHHEVQVLRTWHENRPAGFWVAYQQPDERGIYGFPFANAWKVTGVFYQKGIFSAPYTTNEHDSWLPAWYTRGQLRCAEDAQWFFDAKHLDEFGQTVQDRERIKRYLNDGGFREWGNVQINGLPYMNIYQRTNEPITPRTIHREEWETTFDENSSPYFPLDSPVVLEQKIANPLHLNLGNEIWLEGYDVRYDAPLNSGDHFTLVLYWRAQQPITKSYKVFNQLYDDKAGDNRMQAQLDRYPLCNESDTSLWTPGLLFTDSYYIQVNPDATPGVYGLHTGMYLEETGERLMVLDEAGNVIDSQIRLTDIRIGE